MSSYQGYIRARFNSHTDLNEFIEFLRAETARKPVELNDLVVEFNFFSQGDEALLSGFVREKGASVVEHEVIQGVN